jgi:hypothetical protein
MTILAPPATTEQLNRTAARRYDVVRRIYAGPPLAYVTNALFGAGEPVTLPATTRTTGTVSPATTAIECLSTTGYQSAGAIALSHRDRDTGNLYVARYAYTGKDSDTFTGTTWLTGYEGAFPEGTAITAWTHVSERVIEASIGGASVWRGNVFDWHYSLRGYFYNSMLFPRDGSFMLLEAFTPNGNYGEWTPWRTSAIGYAREYDLETDVDANRWWGTDLVSAWDYAKIHRITARRYGEENLAPAASVTASPHLLRPYDEREEYRGGSGTAVPENSIDDNADTVSISQDTPTLTPDPQPVSGTEGGISIYEVYAFPRPGEPADNQWFALAISPTHPDYATGINLDRLAITNRQTVFVPVGEGGPRHLTGGDFYLRLPSITLSEDNPVVVFCRNAAIFRRYWSVESGVQVFDWRFLPGFGNDQTPGLNFFLRREGDTVQVRKEQSGVDVKARDVVAWGDQIVLWYNAYDGGGGVSAGQWNDPTTVDVPADGSSIRRYVDTNTDADWFPDAEPLPGSTRMSNDGTFRSYELAEWVTHLAANITNASPATGGSLTFDSAAHLDFAGTIQIDDEQIHYFTRKGKVGGAIVRGANGTTPASHTTDALVYQVGEWFQVESGSDPLRLPSAMSASIPGSTFALTLGDTSDLPSTGRIRIDRELIDYTGKTATTVTGITRGAGGTAAADHAPGALIYRYDATLGAHRLPMVGAVAWKRQRRFFLKQIGNQLRSINIGPCNVEIWGSVDPEPNYVSDGDWRPYWIGASALHTWSVPPVQTPLHMRLSLMPRRLRHVMMRVRQMSDYGESGLSGRDKLNEFMIFPHQISAEDDPIGNDEPGIGAVIRDLFEEVFAPNDIIIQAGTFNGTSVNLPVAEGGLGRLWDELAQRYMAALWVSRDNKITIGRHPFHPLGPRPAVKAAFTPNHLRMRVSRPKSKRVSRFGLGQVIATLENEVSGQRYTGYYPPNPTPNGEIRRLSPIKGAFNSVDDAAYYAAMMYLSSPEISDTFTFSTAGPCEWLEAGHRILLWVYFDDAKPLGEYINCLVTSVEYLAEGYSTVTAQEWRMV